MTAEQIESTDDARVDNSPMRHRYRVLSTASAAKIGEYVTKREIALDPSAATAEELALIDREAVARGLDRADLLALILTRAAAFRRAALLMSAVEEEGAAAIAAVPNEADDIETQIQTALANAKTQAAAAFAEAAALINGGV